MVAPEINIHHDSEVSYSMFEGRRIAALLLIIGIYCLPQAGIAGPSLTCPVLGQSQEPESSGEPESNGEKSGEETQEEEPDC